MCPPKSSCDEEIIIPQKRCINGYSICPDNNICNSCICRYPECKNYIDLINVYRNKQNYSENTYNKIVLIANSEYCMQHSGARNN
jgi:hypothetical protein